MSGPPAPIYVFPLAAIRPQAGICRARNHRPPEGWRVSLLGPDVTEPAHRF
jgi:hypothetical protein